MVLTGLRGVDDINSVLDDVKYTPCFLSQLTSFAEEVKIFYCFLLRDALYYKTLSWDRMSSVRPSVCDVDGL